MIDFSAPRPTGDLSVEWMHGQPRRSPNADPPLQVHRYDEHTVILRQSKQLTYEAPFLYLFFGNHTAVLFDTGAVKDVERMSLRSCVDDLIDSWLKENPRDSYRLIVAHTHAHGDHVAGDEQFSDRPNTTVVGKDPESVADFFAFGKWPRETVTLDLGGRVLEVTGNPGHHAAAIAVYDPWTGFLLTGDTVYPGRLYVYDIEAFVESLDALVDIAERRDVAWVMGCHIEMTTTPGVDYPVGTLFQPDEPRLEMTVQQLRTVRDAAHAVKDRPGVHVFDDFAIFNGKSLGGVIKQLLRANGNRLRQLIS